MIERTNIFKGEFSPTGVENAFCYRKMYYNKMLGLVSLRPPLALWFGSAIHSAVETFYKEKDAGVPFLEIKQHAVGAFTESWLEHGVEGDAKRNLATGITIVNNYCEYYKNDTADIIQEFVEAMQWVEMPNGTNLLCKIDRVRRDGRLLTVVDTKTSSWPLTDYYFQGYDNNFQTSMYYYVVSQILGEDIQIQIDGIKVPPPEPGSKTAPFVRRTFQRTELQIADAVNTYCRMTDYIMEGVEKYKDDEEGLVRHMYCNQSKCNDYGGCEYLPVCKYGFKHPSIQVDFRRVEVPK